MDNPSQNVKHKLKKAVTFNGESKPSKKSRRSSSQKKKKQNVRRESVLKPSVYQKIQKKRKSQMLEKKRKSQKLAPILSNTTTSNTTKETPKSDNRRTVFISLRDFYESWRWIPANILSESILILPIYKEWISTQVTQSYIYIPPPHTQNITDMLSDDQFITLLQWKDKQGLLFYMLNHLNLQKSVENVIKHQNNILCNEICPFWHDLSYKLERLYDPDRCDRYRPLLLNERWWKFAYTSMYSSKFNVCAREVLNELHFFTMKFKCIQEILYQSNPSLNVVIKYFDNSNQQLKALESIKNILKQPINIKIDIKSSENDHELELNCDILPSPSNCSSSSHVIGKGIMNSGSEAEDVDADIKLNYNDKSSSSGDESVSSSALFANIAPIVKEKDKSIASGSSSTSSSCPSLNNDMEWWVCPHYYYDTIKSKVDTDCETVSDY